MNPKDVQSYIEGDPFVGVVPVESGLTNTEKEIDGQRIVGMNTENAEIDEGLVRFDIIFYVRMKDGISQVIVNIEAQKERDFVEMKYNDIKRVFSIWVCMNMDENCMDYVHLTNDKLLGSYHWKGRLDLLNIVMIGIADKLPEHDNKYELHRLLSALLSAKLSIDDKLEIIETEYSIPVEDRIRGDVSEMCNLSQGIREMGRMEGKSEIIINMYNNGFSMEQIVLATNKSIEEIKTIIEENKSILVK